MRPLFTLSLLMIAACGFRPSGESSGTEADAAVDAEDDDADPGDGGGDPDAAIDAATIDAATIDAATIDAAMIDATVDAALDASTDAPTDASIDARPACPGTYNVTFNNSRYRFAAVASMIIPAGTDCADDLGGGRTHLATFEIAADMDGAIAAVNPGNSAEPFVGAFCSANDCTSMTLWQWVTGGTVAASLWETGQPNMGTTQKVVSARRVGGVWTINNIDHTTATRPYICECDP